MKLISTCSNHFPIHSYDMFYRRVRSSEQFGPCSVTTRPTSKLIGVPENYVDLLGHRCLQTPRLLEMSPALPSPEPKPDHVIIVAESSKIWRF